MSEPSNGTRYRLDEIERRLRHLEDHGSRKVVITAERVKALEDRVTESVRDLREDIADTRRTQAEARSALGGAQAQARKELKDEIDSVKGTLGKIGMLLLSIPATLIAGIVLFWVQNQ